MSNRFDNPLSPLYIETMPTPNSLLSLGLTSDQATIYLALLDHGDQTAMSLSKITGIKRTYIYHLCQEMVKNSLLKFTRKDRTTFFTPLSPDILLTKAEEKRSQAQTALLSLESLLPDLQ